MHHTMLRNSMSVRENAFLFQRGISELFAATYDHAGANLPVAPCSDGWFRRDWVLLRLERPSVAPLDPHVLAKAIGRTGYYMWKEGDVRTGPCKHPRIAEAVFEAVFELAIVDGPSNSELLRAVTHSDRGQTVLFDTGDDIFKAIVHERAEIASTDRLTFAVKGSLVSGKRKGVPFVGIYDCGRRRGYVE
jgi:hypothetical protein